MTQTGGEGELERKAPSLIRKRALVSKTEPMTIIIEKKRGNGEIVMKIEWKTPASCLFLAKEKQERLCNGGGCTWADMLSASMVRGFGPR